MVAELETKAKEIEEITGNACDISLPSTEVKVERQSCNLYIEGCIT